MTVEDVARVLLRAGLELSPEDLADVVWLLRTYETGPSPSDRGLTRATAVPLSPDHRDENRSPSPEPAPDLDQATGIDQAAHSAREHAPLRLPGRSTATAETRATSVAVPGADALGNRLAFSRSLRALRRNRASLHRTVLDVDLTVNATAQAGRLHLVTRPADEKWLDLVLIFDDASSMAVWQETCSALERSLQDFGGFRTIERWTLRCNGSRAGLLDVSGHLQSAQRLIEGSRHRVVLLLTDGVADHWYRQHLWETIRRWGQVMPLVLVQVLPRRYWSATGIGAPCLRMRASTPGTPNSEFEVEQAWWARGGRADPRPCGAVPVVP